MLTSYVHFFPGPYFQANPPNKDTDYFTTGSITSSELSSHPGGIMRLTRNVSLLAFILLAGFGALARSDEAKEGLRRRRLTARTDVKVKVRMEGPYTADVPLQVVCYFKYTPEGAKKMSRRRRSNWTSNSAASSLPSASAASSRGDQLETILHYPAQGLDQGEGAASRRSRGRGRPFAENHGGGR